MEELKVCPFCTGNINKIYYMENRNYQAVCKNCGMVFTYKSTSHDDAEQTWNTRTPDTSKLHPLSEWNEDDGNVLWWKLPIDEPPYAGMPLDLEWQHWNYGNYYTHWSMLPVVDVAGLEEVE